MSSLSSAYAVLSILNVAVLTGVTTWTLRRYIRIRSGFTLAMVLFPSLLLLDSIIACPVLMTACGVECELSSLPFYSAASAVQLVAILFLVYVLAD